MDKREHFLLHLYDELWRSIDRVEGGLWRFIGLYVSIIGIHWFASKGEIDKSLAAYLTILASFWGINIAINAGKWFERNRMMIINIEKQFLKIDDLGKIMPASYHKRNPRKLFTLLDRIHILVFSAAIVFSVWFYWSHLWSTSATIVFTLLVIIGGIVGTGYHWYLAVKELTEFIEGTKKVDES